MGSPSETASGAAPSGEHSPACARCGDFVDPATGVRLYDGRDYCEECLAATGDCFLREWVLANPEVRVLGRRPTAQETRNFALATVKLIFAVVVGVAAVLLLIHVLGSGSVDAVEIATFLVGALAASILIAGICTAASYVLGPHRHHFDIREGCLCIPIFGSFSSRYELAALRSIELDEPFKGKAGDSPYASLVLIFRGDTWHSVTQSVQLPTMCEGSQHVEAALRLIADANGVARGESPKAVKARGS